MPYFQDTPLALLHFAQSLLFLMVLAPRTIHKPVQGGPLKPQVSPHCAATCPREQIEVALG